jgi:hypothetical protein
LDEKSLLFSFLKSESVLSTSFVINKIKIIDRKINMTPTRENVKVNPLVKYKNDPMTGPNPHPIP